MRWLLFILLLSGCCYDGAYGSLVKVGEDETTVSYVVVGLGWVNVSKKNDEGVMMVDMSVLGLAGDASGIVLGIGRDTVLVIDKDSEVIVDAEKGIFKYKLKIIKGVKE